MQRIGVFGGTFNPVHNGHVIMALRALEQAHLDRLLVIPVHTPSHKDAELLLSPEERLHLVHMAFTDIPGCLVDPRDILRGDPTYTADTLKELQGVHENAHFLFLIGADSVPALPRWKDSGFLAQNLEFLAHPRTHTQNPPTPDGFAVTWLKGGLLGISSTEVRHRLSHGMPVHGFLPEKVRQAILARRIR